MTRVVFRSSQSVIVPRQQKPSPTLWLGALCLLGSLWLSGCGEDQDVEDTGQSSSSGGSKSTDGESGSGGRASVPDKRARLQIVSPEQGTIFSSSAVVLEFRVEDAAATGYSVQVGDLEPIVSEDGVKVGETVGIPLTLAPGVNVIEFVLFDAQGESARTSLVLVFEDRVVTRPSLKILSPASNTTLYGTNVDLEFEARDAGATGYSIQLGSAAATQVLREIAKDEKLTVPVVLSEGTNSITVRLLDSQGEASSQTISVVVDLVDAPVIVWATPEADSILVEEEVQFSGTIQSERSLVQVSYSLNGGPAQALTWSEGQTAFDFTRVVDLGTHSIVLTAKNDLGQETQKSLSFSRELDLRAPALSVVSPRNAQSVKTRRVLVQGSASAGDVSGVTGLVLSLKSGTQEIPVTAQSTGKFQAWLDLEPGHNEFELLATNQAGKKKLVKQSVYFGQKLGASGASGGFIREGALYTWGRNNLGQAGLGFLSHESRATYCSRMYFTADPGYVQCTATSTTNARALCNNVLESGSEAANACIARVDQKRTEVCALAGEGAPANCASATTLSANLHTACSAAYGENTSAIAGCQSSLFCAAFSEGSEEHAGCTAAVTGSSLSFPSVAPPSSATRVTSFSLSSSPAPSSASGVSFESLDASFVSLSFNQLSAAALDSKGQVWTWGSAEHGALCLGDWKSSPAHAYRTIPHRVAEFGAAGTRVVNLSRGFDNLLLLRSDGSVWACGDNSLGQSGTEETGSTSDTPVRVAGLPTNVIQVLATSKAAYALTSDGQVYAWGRNQYANLGNGTVSGSAVASPVPAIVAGLTNVVAIAGGRDHVLAARSDGTVYGWGLNASQQVGAFASPVVSPVQIPGVSDAVSVHANGTQSFYEDSLGRLFGWGANGSTANLGIVSTANNIPNPTEPVFGVSGIHDVAIGALHGYVLREGKVFAWGWSFHGSLGIGPSAIHSWGYRTPMQVKFVD